MAWGTWWGSGPWGACVGGGPDMVPPAISLQTPAPGATGVSPSASIQFRLLDADSGVDPASLYVDLVLGSLRYHAIEGGVINPNFAGTGALLTAISVGSSTGLDVILVPVVPLPVGAVEVDVAALDGGCNAIDTSWTYALADCTPAGCSPFTVLTTTLASPWGAGPWGETPWGGGGSVIIPIPGAGSPVAASISPDTGVTLGGDAFVVLGTDLACFAFNDRFTDGVVDPVLWQIIGAGQTTEGPLGPGGVLHAKTGTLPGTIAGVFGRVLTLNSDFHLALDVLVKTQFLAQKPSGEVVLAGLEAQVDDGNKLIFQYLMRGPTATAGVLRCEVWRYGVLKHEFEQALGVAQFNMGLARYFDPAFNGNRSAFWLNGTRIFESFDVSPCTMNFRFYVSNGGSPYEVETEFDNFISHTVVVFSGPNGSDMATGVVEVTTGRVRGLSPPTRGEWAGAVDIRVTNGSGNGCTDSLDGAWTYQFPEAFSVGRSQPYRPTDSEASFTNDPVLRNPGLSVGLNQRRQ